MRALYFGTYDRDHPRNVNAIAAMRAAGIDVDERRATVHGGGLRGALTVFGAETKLRVPSRTAFDVMIVGYPGHFDVPRARQVAGKRPLVFDAVLSLENELVEVRRRFRPRSTAATVLRAVDYRALRLPDLVVCGTDAEAAYLRDLGAKETATIFLGADDDVFCETWSPTYPFSALYVTDASADVVETAMQQVDVPLRVLMPYELLQDDAGITFAHAGIVLGSFRDSRAIPASVFDALATGAPVITGDTPAARELLADGDSALLVPTNDAAALAGAVRRLAEDEQLRTALAARGHDVFRARASRQVRGEQWRAALDGNALRQ